MVLSALWSVWGFKEGKLYVCIYVCQWVNTFARREISRPIQPGSTLCVVGKCVFPLTHHLARQKGHRAAAE
jgi:hypothetical protein